MWTHSERVSVVLLGWFGTIAMLSSCSGDAPTELDEDQVSAVQISGGRVSVCHRSTNTGVIIDIPQAALASHLRHGDYVTTLHVSHESHQAKDGGHFHHIGDALAAAHGGRLERGELRSAACRITISVAAGVFRGTDIPSNDNSLEQLPFVVDVPAITLRGALVMRLDAKGRATGSSVTHETTTIAPIAPLSDLGGGTLIVVSGEPGGSVGTGLRLEGFVLRSGRAPGTDAAGIGVLGLQARGLTLRGNRLEGFFVAVDLRGSRAVIESNHISGSGQCDVCLSGPGAYRVAGNRILEGATHGIITTPATGLGGSVTSGAAEIFADIINNEIRDHRQLPAAAGVRIGAVGLGAPDVRGSSHVTIRDNLLVNNNFAVEFEAAFPEPDTRLRGDIDATTSGNVVRRSCQANLLVSLTRHVTALGVADDPYLDNSTYRLTLGGDLSFADAWFSNPAGFGNMLLVNGRRIANRTRQHFDPDSCPGTTGAR